MKPNIGIADKNLKNVATLLNELVADEYVLYTKTRRYHWNVQGMYFNDLHKFFEGQYQQLDEIIDSTAERIRQLGHFALGTMNSFLKVTRLLETSEDKLDAKGMLQNLLADHETIIRFLRENIGKCNDDYKDVGTGDYLTGLMEEHEKMAWMIRAFIS
ncbi:MAG TPA: DNA starvation/stationary phase protection protein [Chitinophagaceae bacterium]